LVKASYGPQNQKKKTSRRKRGGKEQTAPELIRGTSLFEEPTTWSQSRGKLAEIEKRGGSLKDALPGSRNEALKRAIQAPEGTGERRLKGRCPLPGSILQNKHEKGSESRQNLHLSRGGILRFPEREPMGGGGCGTT